MIAHPSNATGPLTVQIVEGLYADALVLADEARAAFDGSAPQSLRAAARPAAVALSIEGLRTTTRIMHILAWLLNQRAYMAGELNERQLRLHGALPKDRLSDPEQLALLDSRTRELIVETERLHARIARLDELQRRDAGVDMEDAPVHLLHRKLRSAFG